MPPSEFDTRINRLESRLDKVELLLDASGRVLKTIERAHEHVGRGRRTPLVLVVGSALIAVTVVLVTRRHQAH